MKENGVTLRFLAEPSDVNFGGKVHGGAVMKWIDLAAYACAVGWTQQYCVTAYVSGIKFVAPILVGNMVEVEAKVIYTGTSSVHVTIDVRAGDPKIKNRHLTTHCIIIMVAVDDMGKPVSVPEWIPTTLKEKNIRDSAIRLIEMRKMLDTEMQAHIDN